MSFSVGTHPATLFRGSIATPSLEAAVLNAKYVNSNLWTVLRGISRRTV